MSEKFRRESRYATRSITEEVPVQLQCFLWQSIDEWKNETTELDYLQVFKFEKLTDGLYVIRHSQENPNRETVYYQADGELGIEKVTGKTIFVIDDETHSTMLFASEY